MPLMGAFRSSEDVVPNGWIPSFPLTPLVADFFKVPSLGSDGGFGTAFGELFKDDDDGVDLAALDEPDEDVSGESFKILPCFHLTPQALHKVDGPSGPRRHMGVVVHPQ